MVRSRFFHRCLCVFFASTLLSSCGFNIFETTANKDKDSALFHKAQYQLDRLEFAESIKTLKSMTTDFQAKAEFKRILASAYAGKCGLLFLSFFKAVGEAGSVPLFQIFMKAFTQKAVDPASCYEAAVIMREIGSSASVRSSEDNLFLAILSMAMIGSYIKSKADVDSTGGLGDGVVDTTFNSCDAQEAAPGQAFLTDDDVKSVVVGFSLLLENIAYLSAVAAGNSAATAVTDFLEKCNIVAAGSGGDNPCLKFTIADVTQPNVIAFRNILKTSTAGLGDCTDEAIITCCPP